MEPSDLTGTFTHPIQLVVADMDGTFLDAHHEIPEAGIEMLQTLAKRGIRFVPASGRQYWRLLEMFERFAHGMPFIADNGTLVMKDGTPLSVSSVDPTIAGAVIDRARSLKADVGVVVCTEESAYVDRDDEPFLEECRKYYAHLNIVEDIAQIDAPILKVAVFDFDDAEQSVMPVLGEYSTNAQIVLSGKHWVDVMPLGASKGKALEMIQQNLGIKPENTMEFGDYINDLDMFDYAHYSFAMTNAHPDLHEAANFIAPSNTDEGVITVVNTYLEHHHEQ